MFWKKRKDRVPEKLAEALSELAMDAYLFGRRFTMHAKLDLPVKGMTGRTEEQKVFDHEYIGIVLSWIGLAVEMTDADLKFGDGPPAERYAQTIEMIYGMIADKLRASVCPFESNEYLHEAFTRYLPPAGDAEAARNHIDFQFALFERHLKDAGVIVNPEILSVCLAEHMLRMETQIYSLTESYSSLIAEYCHSS